ncbi:autotransporter assembly complex protein TamB [Vibrio nitrifigilis]|uniref:Translocation/assembly module TamB n=1 Tax=Vibrio nitrifigilis TaxID=2789781 RepID=A0ABS0GH03_9VIBR|nr:translocation/assembly module TamB domain-containing protein [Vibrio nitrifigilis]MBF9001708.1 translocation/assembly module TamB [Vibrio nitrifigilis]
MIHIALKWTKLVSLFLTALLLITAVFVGSLLFSHSGLKTILVAVQSWVPQLTIKGSSGALYPSFTLKGVRYNNPDLGIDVTADSLSLGIKGHCLLEPAICLRTVKTTGLHLTLRSTEPSAEDTSADSGSVTGIATPIPLYIPLLIADDTELDIHGTKLNWQHLETRASMRGNRIELGKTLWQSVQLQLAKSEAKPQGQAPKKAQSNKQVSPITLPEITIPVDIDVEQFDVHDFTLVQDSPVIVRHLGLKGSAYNHDVTIKQLNVNMPQGKANLYGQATLSGGYPLNLNLDTTLNLKEFAGQRIQLTANGSVANLTMQAQLSGQAKARLQGQLKTLEPNMPFALHVTQVDAQWPLRGEADYQLKSPDLVAQGNLQQYRIALQGSASGKAIPTTHFNLQGKGSLHDIQLSSLALDTLGGHISGTAAANWQGLVNWQANVDMQDIQPGKQWPQAQGNISGHVETSGSLTEQGGWQIQLPKLSVDGEVRDYPLHVAGQLTASDASASSQVKVKTQGITLAHGLNKITAHGTLDDVWNLDVAVHVPDLSKSLPDAQGNIEGTLQFRGQAKQPDIQLSVAGKQIHWQKLVDIDQVSLTGSVSPLVEPTLDLVVQGENIRYQQEKISRVTIKAQGSELKHHVSLDLTAPDPKLSTHLAVSGKLTQKPTIKWQGQIDQWSITSPQGRWAINKATALSLDVAQQTAHIAAHCWQQGDASICLDKDASLGKSGAVNVSIHQLNFAQIDGFLPQETRVKGVADMSVTAKWSKDHPPQVKATATVSKGQLTQELTNPLVIHWDKVSVNSELRGNKLTADWSIDVTNNGDLTGNIMIPDVTQAQRQMQGHLKLTPLNIDFLANQFGDYSKVAAHIDTDLSFKGEMLHPQVQGQLNVKQIGVSGDVTPVEVKSGDIQIGFSGYQAQLRSDIETQDGKLQLTGNADWADMDKWAVNAHVGAQSLLVDMPPMVEAKVVPDLSLSLKPKLASITGNIKLPWGRVTVEELPPSAVSVSKDQVILNKDLKPVDKTNRFPFEIQTAVSIDIGDDFLLDAFGLKAGLIGHLNVSQKDKGPFVTGEVNLEDGTYTSFGQDLIIKEGKILMNGPVDQPYLSINAIRNPDNTEDDVTAGIKVTGPVDEPKVSVYSDPSMPQANALSYLLRGQDIDGEGGGNSMTTTLIGLSLAQSGKLVGELGEAVGVQDLQLDTSGSGDDSQVTVSGYILPGLQVKYGVGIFNSVGEFTVRYRLMKDLYVEAVSGLTSAVDILYQFEFD